MDKTKGKLCETGNCLDTEHEGKYTIQILITKF